MIIDSVYKLSPPPKLIIDLRQKKIEYCKLMMGEKWLLAKPIKRKDAK